MNNRTYIKIIRELIETESEKTPLLHLDFINLFSKISNSSIKIFELFQYPPIDPITLKMYYDIALNEFLSLNPIDIEPSHYLVRNNKTWLTEFREKKIITWNYSERYFEYLGKIGRSKSIIQNIRYSSLDILSKTGDPKSTTPFFIKGLVVGEVQSGKTENFNAVINRAIDSGYGLILVLSGIMEDLRSQTQLRIEKDVVGEGIIDIERERYGAKGVGEIRRFGLSGSRDINQAALITSYKADFNTALEDAKFSLNNINILVCKKNHSVLKNLIWWLHGYIEENKEQHNIPLFLIDDEADNASLNNLGVKGKNYASKINGHIRALLALFQKKTYLGYTATPFANVLADRNDVSNQKWVVKNKDKEILLSQVPNLAPEDFIVLLPPPVNYIGAKQFFETMSPIENEAMEKIPLVEIVDDHMNEFPDTGKQHDVFPKNLPLSLQESILCFLLSIAVRTSRKEHLVYSTFYNPHHSMLIHVSRFTLWQNRTRELVKNFISKVEEDIKNDNPSSPTSIYSNLKRIWYKYYAEITGSIEKYLPKGYQDKFLSPVTFETLINHFPDAVSNIEVKAINSSTKEKLTYVNNSPKKIIAVGGNRLSRGFTLEGLTVNYFIRTTNYSDTLFQMGRWFGYRPGYLDCCKLFTTQDLIDKFDFTTLTVEELEAEFRKMEYKGKSPLNFVIRVKKHPGTLKITRPQILKNAKKVVWSFQDTLSQTTTINLNQEKIIKNWEYFKNSIAPKFIPNSYINPSFLTYKTNIKELMRILESENNFDKDTCNSMISFLEICEKEKKLLNWTIALKITGDASETKGKGILNPDETNLPVDINLSIRRPRGPQGINEIIKRKILKVAGKSANIMSSPKDISLTLTPEQIRQAESSFRSEQNSRKIKVDDGIVESHETVKSNKGTIPERVYREQMSDQEGILIIYLFDLYYSLKQEKGEEHPEIKRIFVDEERYDLNIPLIGYVIGIPPIEPDPIGGAEYYQGDYEINEDEIESEYVYEDSELPEDHVGLDE